MTTKTLYLLSAASVFIAGLAFGYAIHPTAVKQPLVPQTEREQTFYDSWQKARLATTSPTVNFRVSVNGAARDYIYGLGRASRSVVSGADVKSVSSIIDTRSLALGASFSPVMDAKQQATLSALWKNLGSTSIQYAQSKVTVSAADKADAEKAMATAVEQLATFFADTSDVLPVATIQTALSRVVSGLQQAMNESTGNSVVAVFASEQSAAQNLGNLMDSLTSTFVQQNPSKF
jgi:hypothetical protein